MRNLNIMAKNALKKVTTDPPYSVSVRADFDRTWTYRICIAYKDVVLHEQEMVITETTQEEIEKKFFTMIHSVLIEEGYKEWIDFLVQFDNTVLPNYMNHEAQIYWTGLEATIYAPNLAAAERAYEEWTGEKGNVKSDNEGAYYAE